MMSKAQLSEATTKLSGWPSAAFIFPSESGRTPCGSRKATTACLVMTTVEKAPSSRGITSATASSIQSFPSPARFESSAAMISESDVPRSSTPDSRSSLWSSTALVRLPLCARASSRPSSRQTGCAFSHAPPPVVE